MGIIKTKYQRMKNNHKVIYEPMLLLKKHIKGIFIFLLMIIVNHVHAQIQLKEYLAQVEANNSQLAAYRELMEAQILEQEIHNLPENPVVEYGYFPGDNDVIGDKKVYGVSQSMDFPSVYFIRSKSAEKQKDVIRAFYEVERKDILLIAKMKWNEYIYSIKLENEYKQRVDNAEKIYNSYVARLNQGNASILEVNKAKILYLSSKSRLEIHRQEQARIYNDLVLLNGNNKVDVVSGQYPFMELVSLDQLKSEMIQKHPGMLVLSSEIEHSQMNVRLSRHEWLPSFQFGYEAESEPDGTYAGFKAGLSVPLWYKKNTVQHANARLRYSNSLYEAKKLSIMNNLESDYKKALEYKDLLNEFDELLLTNNDISFIEKALDLGQISIIEYINELSMYYDIVDLYLETEKEYYQTLSKIFYYTL